MHPQTRTLVTALATGLSCFLFHGQLTGQCEKSQGNAHLELSGLKFLGSTVTPVLEGRKGGRFILAVDAARQTPSKFPWGTICLGPNLFPLASGLILSQSSQFTLPIGIPNNSALQGLQLDLQGIIEDAKAPNGFLAISNLSRLTVGGVSPVQTIFFDDFEVVSNRWFASNGLWQVGKLTNSKVGPPQCYSGSRCAGTELARQYPAGGANTRFESPTIQLPNVKLNQQIRVNYRMWFSTEDLYDTCSLVVSTDRGRNWSRVNGSTIVSGWNRVWTQFGADLSAYAGKSILLGYEFKSTNRCTHTSSCFVAGDGVYIDDVHVFLGTPVLQKTEGWEKGIGFWWHGDNGLWQAGAPSNGPKLPSSTNSSSQCVGTLLGANYPSGGANTRLVSPPVKLPTVSSKIVRDLIFKMWISTEVNWDYGQVQVSTDGGKTWLTLPQTTVTGQSTSWTNKRVPLIDDSKNKIAIQGKTILIAFNFVSRHRCTHTSSCFVGGNGWYIDDIQIR